MTEQNSLGCALGTVLVVSSWVVSAVVVGVWFALAVKAFEWVVR